jgi:DNA mismatch endonuclease (patch repair protein)
MSKETTSASTRRPPPLNPTVSAQMRRMGRASTGPELRIRKELHRRGLRFRVNHRMLPGRPDIAFTRARLAVFIDGCFWHQCPEHGVIPKNNHDWWHKKLRRNVERDQEKDAQLGQMGWQVLRFWEHEDPTTVARVIEERWRVLRDAPTGGSRSPRGV